MSRRSRCVIAFLLLAAAGLCVLGFLASFEPGTAPLWRVGYPAVGLLCVLAAMNVLFR